MTTDQRSPAEDEAPAARPPATTSGTAALDLVAQPRGAGAAAAVAATRHRRRRMAATAMREVPVLLVFTALAVALHWTVWQSPGTSFTGQGNDPGAFVWYMQWTPFALTHHHDPFLSYFINYPAGVNLAWHTPIYAVGLALWPVTAVWGPLVSYNVVMTGCFALSAYCAYLAVRRWVRNRVAAVAGGFVYGFSPYMLAQGLGHANLVVTFTAPLMLIVLDEILVRRRHSWALSGALLGALATVQFYTSVEVLATEALVGAIAVALLAALHWRRVTERAVRAAKALGLAALMTLVLMAPATYIMLFGPNRFTGTVQGPAIYKYANDLLNFVVPTQVQAVDPPALDAVSAHFTGNIAEWNGYLGVPLLLILIFTVIRFRRRPLVRFAGLCALVTAVLSLGTHLHVAGRVTGIPLPYLALSHLPVLDNLLPARLMLYTYLFAGMLLAVFVAEMVLTRRPWRAVPATVALIAAAILLFPSLPTHMTPVPAPAFFTSAAVRQIPQDAVVAMGPYPDDYNLGPQIWQAEAAMRFRILGGRFEHLPGEGMAGPALYPAMVAIEQGKATGAGTAGSLGTAVRGDLCALGVRFVIVGPGPAQPQLTALFANVLGRPGRLEGGVWLWPVAPSCG